MKNWCFWTVMLERLLRIPWTARRSNQSILKEVSPECSLEGLMFKLKQYLATWCEELTHWKRPWCWERLKAGGEGDNRGWDGWMASPTQWTWVWTHSGSQWWTEKSGMLQSIGSQRVRHNWVTELIIQCYIIHFIAQMFPLLATGSSLHLLLCFSCTHVSLWVWAIYLFILAFLYFLWAKEAPDLSWLFLVQHQNQSFLQGALFLLLLFVCVFYWKWWTLTFLKI